ncbi:MAG: helix-turn-helix domain-containing protein [Halanaerobium sp.]
MEELELGTVLKRARQNKGLTIDQIQEKTKIRKKYLEAIEENNFDVLPGTVYLKVFVKGYARIVDLNYQALLDNYPVLHQVEEKKELKEDQEFLSSTNTKRSPKKLKNYTNIFKWAFIIIFAVILIFASVFAYQYFTNIELRLLNEPTAEENINGDHENEPEDGESLSSFDNNQEEETADNPLAQEEVAESEYEIEVEDEDLDNLAGNQIPVDDNNFENIDPLVNNNQQNGDILNDDNLAPESSAPVEDGEAGDEELNNENETAETEDAEAEAEEESAEDENADDEDAEDEAEEESAEDDTEDGNAENEEEEPAEEEDDLQTAEITINNDEPVWLNVTADEEDVFTGILEVEESLDYEIEDRLYIKMGLADAVTVNVNGEEFGPFTGADGVAEVEFILEDGEITFNDLRE